MPTKFRSSTLKVLAAALLFSCLTPSGAGAESGERAPVRLSLALHPAAEAAFVPSPGELPLIQPPAEWYVRTGARKGLSGNADTETELFIAPDVAVLDRGLSAVWPFLLSGYQEAAVLVRPGDVAGLSSSKDLLIIPSGGLANTEGSALFKASLARFAADGGTILCLAQRRGADFTALPVPEGRHLNAVGWSEDAGPLFRASTSAGNHPLLRDLTKPAPLVETDGYIRNWPPDADVLLIRPDGFPTLIAYPFGKGRVVVSTLFTDLNTLLGSPEEDEKLLLRSLLSWSRTHPADKQAAPDAAQPGNGTALAGPAVHLKLVHAAVRRKADTVRAEIELPGSAALKDTQVLVRIAGQERSSVLSRGTGSVAFDIPVRGSERRLSYAVYGKDGRSLARGSLAVPAANGKAVPERPFTAAGEPASVIFSDIGRGEVTIDALGFMTDRVISDNGTMIMDVPPDLPAGTYPIQWVFADLSGNKRPDLFPLDIGGYRVAVTEASVQITRDRTKSAARANITIAADRNVSGQLHLALRGTDNRTTVLSEPVLSLVPGAQTIPVGFDLDPSLAGQWELTYRISTVLPETPSLPTDPLTLDAGSVLFDTGDTAVLAIVPQPLLQYEPGPLSMTALLVSKGSSVVNVLLDGREIGQEKTLPAGSDRFTFSVPPPAPGTHTVRVSLKGTQGTAAREERVVSGLRLPDIAVTLQTGRPEARDDAPVMPLVIAVENRGKTGSSPVHIVIADGDPSQGGKGFAALDIPALAAKERASRTFAWPLYGNAGKHTIVAVADPDRSAQDADRDSNRASVAVTVPNLLLIAPPPAAGFSAADRISLPMVAFNLGGERIQGLKLRTEFTGQAGKVVSSDTVPVPDIAPAARLALDQPFKLKSPLAGTYGLTAGLASPSHSASTEVRFSVLPTLQFTGSLEGTPAAAVQCRSFTIRTSIRSSGNILHSAGTARLEAIPAGNSTPLPVRTFPFATGERSTRIESLDLPAGTYKLRLVASVRNDQFKLSKEMTLAERDLTVSGPIEARRLEGSFPRVLILRGRDGRVVEQAVAESMLQQAFEQDDIFSKTVESVEEFMAQGMTGKFNTYLLYEPQEIPKTGWLKERVAEGRGVIVAGSGDAVRAAGEELGFTFRDLPKRSGRLVAFTDRSPLGLTGTLPVSGKSLQVSGPDAVPVAHFEAAEQAAIVVDRSRKGKIVVLPLSLSKSAYEDGTMALLSLVLRKAALFAAPETDSGSVRSGGLSLTSPGGQLNARVIQTLLPGTRLLWSNLSSSASGTAVTYTVKADRDPRKLLYLYEFSGEGPKAGPAEVFFECGDRYVSQGRTE